MIARILAILSSCGLVWIGVSYLEGAKRIGEQKNLPTWPDKQSESFPLQPGEGTWTVGWDPVSGAVGNGTLWVAERIRWPLPDELRVLARVQPSIALLSARTPEGDGWVRVGDYPDYTHAITIDPTAVGSIEYKIVTVPPDLIGKRAFLWVQGSGDSEHFHEAIHREAANIYGSIILGAPMLLVLISSLIVMFFRRCRASLPAEEQSGDGTKPPGGDRRSTGSPT